MMADALANATDTKACVVGPGAADGAAAMFRELFPSDAKAILVEDPRTKSVAGDNVASRLKGAGVKVSEYVVNPDGSDFHATYAKVEEVREAIRASSARAKNWGCGTWSSARRRRWTATRPTARPSRRTA